MIEILIRSGGQVELWYGKPNDLESDIIGTFHYSLCPKIIAALKRFEQSEGRHK